LSFFIHIMNNFSKFLTNREDLRMVFDLKPSSAGVYFISLLFLLAFFMLWPMWNIGYHGLVLWLCWVVLLIFLLSKKLINQNNVYLLTDKRLIHLQVVFKTNYKLMGFIKILDINKVYKQKNNIIIVSKNKKYYLSSINSAEQVYRKLNYYIKR